MAVFGEALPEAELVDPSGDFRTAWATLTE